MEACKDEQFSERTRPVKYFPDWPLKNIFLKEFSD